MLMIRVKKRKKNGQKTSALFRITPFMELPKRWLLMNTFFMSQYSYCPVVWMCLRRIKNNTINRPNERWLRTVYNDKFSTFEEY